MNINHIDLTPLRTGLTLPLSTGQIDTKWQKIQTSINEIVDKVNANTEAFEEITRVDLLVLMSNDEVVPGKQYMIIDAQASNPNCLISKVLVTGTSVNTVSVSAHRFMLVPDYTILEIWHDTLPTPAIGNKVIYGSRVWTNLTGNIGNTNNSNALIKLLELDSNWEQVPYTKGDDYIYRTFEISYNIQDDYIEEQRNIGILSQSIKATYGFTGINFIDYCDWNYDRKGGFFNGNIIGLFVNNPNLDQMNTVYSPVVANNMCDFIANVTVVTEKLTTKFEDLPGIQFNKCVVIACINNTQPISSIPSTVDRYMWVTDDESGYLEHDFNVSPLLMGETLVLGCIINKEVSLYEALINSDGNLTSGVSMQFGLEIDAVDYFTPNTDFINSHARRVADISNRTTDFNRLILLTALDGNITSGKIYIAYKYV